MEWRFIPAGSTMWCPQKRDWSWPMFWLNPALHKGDWKDVFPRSILVTYPHWKDEVEPFDHGVTDYIFGDSGGFTVLTLGIAIDPAEVMHWQVRRTDVGAILDVPPFAKSHHIATPFQTALDRTVSHVRQALPLYDEYRTQGTDFRWWGAAHGRTWKEIEHWYEAVARVYPFEDQGEGWSFNPHGRTEEAIACTMGYLRTRGLRHVHALGIGGQSRIATLLCLGVLGDYEFVTFDSSNSTQFAINAKVWEQPNQERPAEAPTMYFKDAADELMMDCDCLACVEMRVDLASGVHDKRILSYMPMRRDQHNMLLMYKSFKRIWEACKDDPEGFLREHLPDKFPHIMRAFEHGIRSETYATELQQTTTLLDFV